jgi:hypothetical protein
VKTENLLVKETILRCVHAERTLVVEVPEGLRDHSWLRRIVHEGDQDYGPFHFDPVGGTEYGEPLGLQILGVTSEQADIPCLDSDPQCAGRECESHV